MQKTLLFSIMIFLLAGCKKEKFASTPSLKYESVNNRVLSPGGIISFTLSFTDAEGDLTGNLYVEKFEPKCAASNFNESYPVPVFPSGKNQAGKIIVSFGYNVDNYPPILPPQCPERDDTCVFKFVLKDKANHVSDTAVSESVVILR